MKPLTFSKIFVLTIIILFKTIYQQVCISACQKPTAGSDFGGVFRWKLKFRVQIFWKNKTLRLCNGNENIDLTHSKIM